MSMNSDYATTLLTAVNYISITINTSNLILGTLGGICNILTFTAPQLRQNSCVFYLLCATILQLLSILFVVPTRMAIDNFGNNLINQSPVYCKVRYYLALTLPELATYYMSLSIVDRCFATSRSVGVRAWSQLKVAHRLSASVLIIGLTSNIHFIIFYGIYNEICQTPLNSEYGIFFAGYTIIVLTLFPHLLMIFAIIITFLNIKRLKRRISPTSIMKPSSMIKSFEKQLIAIVFMYAVIGNILLLLRIGTFSYQTVTNGNLNKTVDQLADENFVGQLGTALYFLNFAISFYVTILTSKYFRDIFWKRIRALCYCHQ